MGVLLSKCFYYCCCNCCCLKFDCCNCCSCCCCCGDSCCDSCGCCTNVNNYSKTNSVGVMPKKQLKLLILGASLSGKTEIAHVLSKTERRDFEATNGSKFYQIKVPPNMKWDGDPAGLTEIGGSRDMQKLWHHYYATCMGLIYCFDMSSNYEQLSATFQVLEQILMHQFMRGKPILLVGTKSDLVSEGLQLYDIENAFQLEAMSRKYSCSLRMCYFGKYPEDDSSLRSLIDGFHWLLKFAVDNYGTLKKRTQRDANIKIWQEQTEKLIAEGKMRTWRYRRFPHHSKLLSKKTFYKFASQRRKSTNKRPRTAPSVYTIFKANSTTCILSPSQSSDMDSPNTVPIEELNNSNEEENGLEIVEEVL